MESLIARGFESTALWELRANSRLQLNRDSPKEPGIYAFAVDGEVCYVGKAEQGIAKRMRVYETIRKTTKGDKKPWREPFQTLIRAALENGSEVTLLTLVILEPLKWNGHPVNLFVGIEDALIREIRPKWNPKKYRRAAADAIRNKKKDSEISN